jgi:hypothetical protein
MQALKARNIPSAAFSSATVSAIRRRRLSRAFPMKQRLVDGPFVGESGDQEFLRPPNAIEGGNSIVLIGVLLLKDFNNRGSAKLYGAPSKDKRRSPDNLAVDALELARLMPPRPRTRRGTQIGKPTSLYRRRTEINNCKAADRENNPPACFAEESGLYPDQKDHYRGSLPTMEIPRAGRGMCAQCFCRIHAAKPVSIGRGSGHVSSPRSTSLWTDSARIGIVRLVREK